MSECEAVPVERELEKRSRAAESRTLKRVRWRRETTGHLVRVDADLCVPVRLGRGVLRALARPCTAVYRVLGVDYL